MNDAVEFVFDENDDGYQVVAHIHEARWYENLGSCFINGRIRNDRLGRYKDGQEINTTYISRQIGDDAFLTRAGNVYKVVSWAKPPMA